MRLTTRIAVTFILLLPIGCAEPEPPTVGLRDFPLPEDAQIVETQGEYGGVLRYPLPGEPSTFNYVVARQESRGRLFAHLTTGTLLEFDPMLQEVRAGVCNEWKVSEDGQTVTLSLRRGLRFSDGVPASTEDVLFTFERIYEEGSTNPLKNMLLVNGNPLQVKAIDSHAFEVKFPAPHAAAEYFLTTVPVLPRHLLGDESKKIEEYWTLDTPPAEMAGLGSFGLAAHQPGEKTVLRFNPHYWRVDSRGNRLPYLDQLEFHYIQERGNHALRFQAGELDLLDQLLRAEDFNQLEGPQSEEADVNLQDVGPSNTLTFLWFNLNRGRDPESGKKYLSAPKIDWFENLKFRQAVATAVSRDAIVRNVYLGYATPARTIVPATFQAWYTDDVPRYEYNEDRARELLRAGGFSWKSTGVREVLVDARGQPVKFEMLTRADDVLGKIAAIIQQDLNKLGMQVTLRQEEFRTVISRVMRSRDYDAAIMNIALPVEPVDHRNVLLSSGPMHMWRPSQSEPATAWEKRIDHLMSLQVTTLNRQNRQSSYREIQQILGEQVPIIPLIHRDLLVASKKQLKNLRPVSLFPYGLWNVWELWMDDK